MSHTKCSSCGLVNWLTPEFCERCGAPLGGGDPNARTPESTRPDFQPLTLWSDGMTASTSSKPEVPPVWKWYVAYCAGMVILYFLMVIMGVVFLAIPARLATNPQEAQEAQEAQVWGLLTIALGMLFLAPYAAAPFLPRRKWAWIVGVVLIGIGMTSMCCLPAAVPLLIFWLKPENKEFFDVDSEGRQGA